MTPAEATKIYRRFHPYATSRDKHPLDGKSVREWVAEARAGWPRVPVPKDPVKAAQKVTQAYCDNHDLMKYEELS